MNRAQKRVRPSRANLLGRWEGSENADRTHAGAPGHLNVLFCIAYINGLLRLSAQLFECESQGSWMRFFLRSILAANTRAEILGKIKIAELPADSAAIPAGNNGEIESASKQPHDASRAGHKFWVLLRIGAGPKPVGFAPLRTRDTCRSIDAIPVGRIVAREFLHAPVDPESTKHGEISARIGGVRVEERAVPVEEDGARGKSLSIHGAEIVPEKRDSAGVVALREYVVAA